MENDSEIVVKLGVGSWTQKCPTFTLGHGTKLPFVTPSWFLITGWTSTSPWLSFYGTVISIIGGVPMQGRLSAVWLPVVKRGT